MAAGPRRVGGSHSGRSDWIRGRSAVVGNPQCGRPDPRPGAVRSQRSGGGNRQPGPVGSRARLRRDAVPAPVRHRVLPGRGLPHRPQGDGGLVPRAERDGARGDGRGTDRGHGIAPPGAGSRPGMAGRRGHREPAGAGRGCADEPGGRRTTRLGCPTLSLEPGLRCDGQPGHAFGHLRVPGAHVGALRHVDLGGRLSHGVGDGGGRGLSVDPRPHFRSHRVRWSRGVAGRQTRRPARAGPWSPGGRWRCRERVRCSPLWSSVHRHGSWCP
jgi:hypothetical protein